MSVLTGTILLHCAIFSVSPAALSARRSLYYPSHFILPLFSVKCKMAAAATIWFLIFSFITSGLNSRIILNTCSVTSSLCCAVLMDICNFQHISVKRPRMLDRQYAFEYN